jgi:aryl-alcohol dehydrogenase-like predicted oxidoreductase
MRYRDLGRTGMQVSEIGFGGWAIGGGWGAVDDETSLRALHRAVDLGVRFFDTADNYGNGRSEQLLARLRKERKERLHIATKAGQKLTPQVSESWTPQAIAGFVEESLRRLETERLELLQLHSPPNEIYYRPEIFEGLDNLVRQGKLANYGVSVRKAEEGLKAIEYPNLKTVQIVFNMFRQRPAELFFREAQRRKIGVIVRVPLASGLLTGKMKADTQFDPSDHRNFNREGQRFDRGETFAGVDYATGLKAVEELRKLLPKGMSMAQFALRWILMFDAVSTIIPGAKNPSQVEDNVAAAEFPPLSDAQMAKVREIYDTYIRPQVHHRW